MALHSPAVHASRAATSIDPQRQAEYPILLGRSLQEDSQAAHQFVSLRYNWKAKHVSAKQKTVLTKAKGPPSGDAQYQLTTREADTDTKPVRYTGSVYQPPAPREASNSSAGEQPTELALIFDRQKSAFILERISAALDFNLISAPGQSNAEIQAHPKLQSARQAGTSAVRTDQTTNTDSTDDQEPDENNPYDFRHFLDEAKLAAEKPAGNRTPLPGSLSGMASPVPGASRYRPSSGPGTPLARPAVTSVPIKKRKNLDDNSKTATSSNSRSAGVANKSQPTTKPMPSASVSISKPKTLSKERVSDSDSDSDSKEEIGDTITLSNKAKAKSKLTPRDTAPSSTRSPRIEVDEAADLVIDMGSPTQHTIRPRAWIGGSPFARALPPNTIDAPRRHVEEQLSDRDAEGEDEEMPDADGDAEEDADVEDLVLGSPHLRVDEEDEDEDDELAAELEAALDEDGDGDGDGDERGFGLGISTTGPGPALVVEEESEVSEEE